MEEQYKDIGYQITGAIFEVAHNLGPGLLEKCYEKALLFELNQRKVDAIPQYPIRVIYKGVDLGLDYYADILVDNRAIIEIKAVSELNEIHRAQLLNYLRLSGIEYGVLVNFNKPRADIERFFVKKK